MKKTTVYSTALILVLTCNSLISKASVNPGLTSVLHRDKIEKKHSDSLLSRLSEIKEMDKSVLNNSQKKELRNEVRSIKKSLIHGSGGIFLSVGAILVIALVLILLL